MPFIGTFTHNRRTKAEHKPSGSTFTSGGSTTIPVSRGIRTISVYAIGGGGGAGSSDVAYSFVTNPGSYDPVYQPGTNRAGSAGGGGGAAAANKVKVQYGWTVTATGGTGGTGGTGNTYTYSPASGDTLATSSPGAASDGNNSSLTTNGTTVVTAYGGGGGTRGPASTYTYITNGGPGGGGSVGPASWSRIAHNAESATNTGGAGGRGQNWQFTAGGGGGAAGWNSNGGSGSDYTGPSSTTTTGVNAQWVNYYASSNVNQPNTNPADQPTAAGGGGLKQTGGGISSASFDGSPVSTPIASLDAIDGSVTISFPSPYDYTYGSYGTNATAGDYNHTPTTSSPTNPTTYGYGAGAVGGLGRNTRGPGADGNDGAVHVKWGYDADFRYNNIKQPVTFSQGGYNNIQYESDGSLSPFSASVTAPGVPINEGSTKTYSISTVNPPSPSATFYYRMFLEDSDGTERNAPTADISPISGSITLSLGEATKTITVVEDETTEPLHDFMKMKISATGTSGPWIAESPIARINDTSQTPPPLNPGYVLIGSSGVTAARADGVSITPTMTKGPNYFDIPSDDGINYINVLALGGGGGGSGGNTYTSYPSYSFTVYGGTGGGGGETRIVEQIPVSPGQRIYFGVGSGGSAGPGPASPYVNRAGGDGGPSWINFSTTSDTTGDRIVAAGGQGGIRVPTSRSVIGGGGAGYTPGGGVFGVSNSRSVYRWGGKGGGAPYYVNPGYTPGQIRNLSTAQGGGGGGAGLNRSYSSAPYNSYAGYGAFSTYGSGSGVAGSNGSGSGGQTGGKGGGFWLSGSTYTHPDDPSVMGPLGYQPTAASGRLGNSFTTNSPVNSFSGGGGYGGSSSFSAAPNGSAGTVGGILVTWGDNSYLDASSPRAPSTVRNNNGSPNFP